MIQSLKAGIHFYIWNGWNLDFHGNFFNWYECPFLLPYLPNTGFFNWLKSVGIHLVGGPWVGGEGISEGAGRGENLV